MGIQVYENGIHRDTNVYGKNVYLGQGQGCGTIWFKNVPSARCAFEQGGVKAGHDLFDCTKCACHYSISDLKRRLYPEYACHKMKEGYAQSFERKDL